MDSRKWQHQLLNLNSFPSVLDTTSNNGKQYPRQSRRREPPGPKWDQNKKNFGQKQSKGTYDNKRPKPRGPLYYGCGKANTQV